MTDRKKLFECTIEYSLDMKCIASGGWKGGMEKECIISTTKSCKVIIHDTTEESTDISTKNKETQHLQTKNNKNPSHKFQ